MSDPLVLVAVGGALGLVLGLLGGGGGILAVPLLVAIGEPVLSASTMSLVIVGTAAAAALVPHHQAERVDWPVGLTFGALGAAGAILGSRVAQSLSPSILLAGLAVLLVYGSFTMLRAGHRARLRVNAAVAAAAASADDPASVGNLDGDPDHPAGRASAVRVVTLASVVGFVTGLFGVGAGFVVVPALVSAMRLPIRKATATALVVIVINSSVALVARHGSLGSARDTLALAAASAVFAVLGALLSSRIPAWVLSTAFGSLMVLVAVYTLAQAAITA